MLIEGKATTDCMVDGSETGAIRWLCWICAQRGWHCANWLAQIELTDHDNLHIIIGMVKDKEIEKDLLPARTATYTLPAPGYRVA